MGFSIGYVMSSGHARTPQFSTAGDTLARYRELVLAGASRLVIYEPSGRLLTLQQLTNLAEPGSRPIA